MLNFFKQAKTENQKVVNGKVVKVMEWPIDSKPSKDPWTRHSQLNK